jgi:hypothetical protein
VNDGTLVVDPFNQRLCFRAGGMAFRRRRPQRADEITLQVRLTVVQQQGNHFLEVGLQLVERRPPARGAPRLGAAGKPGPWPTSRPVSLQHSITAE